MHSSSLDVNYVIQNIWLDSDSVFKKIKEAPAQRSALAFYFLSGFLAAASEAVKMQYKSITDTVIHVLLVPVVIGGLFLGFAYPMAFLLASIGKLLGGKVNTVRVFYGLGFCQIPGIVISILGIATGIILSFFSESPLAFIIPMNLFVIALTIWSFYIYLTALSILHGFSKTRALATILLTIPVIAIAVFFLYALLDAFGMVQ